VAWTIIGLGFIIWFVAVLFFTPRIDYRVSDPIRPDSDEFLHVIQSTCQAAIYFHNKVEILTNGAQFYPAMRDAIRAAESSVNLEAYIFRRGEAADMLIDAMVERARAGVEIRVTLDAVGSAFMFGEPLKTLREAGCKVQFYQTLTWYRFHRLNNRTHRELLVVDGRIAFTGGAGVADQWLKPHGDGAAWRDTMVRIDGPIVAALQGVFAENWLECCGEILSSPRQWPRLGAAGPTEAMLVKSSPSDRATASRVVFQLLMEGAVGHIDIQTPYFLPDQALRRVLIRASRRGVRVRVVVPGKQTDQRLVRLASRRMYRELLDAGIRLYEYRPSMTHLKVLMVDDVWAVIGTTNVDNRSFEHNDEVNVAFREADVTARLRRDFEADLAASDEITLEEWGQRSTLEKLVEPVCWILERQQ
jgi:cardiolipin synthase A/B